MRTLAAALILAGLTSGMERPVFRPAAFQQSPSTTGIITGRVMLSGFPADQAEVYARAIHVVNGERRVTALGARAVTNRDGYYRVVGLKPGQYVVSAEPAIWDLGRRTDPLAAQQPTLHPSTTDLTAAHVVRVDAGAEAHAIDVECALAPALAISGRIVTSDGRPALQPIVRVQSVTPFGVERTARFFPGLDAARSGDGSTFVIGGLPPGRYALTAQPDSANIGDWARTEVVLDGRSVTDLVLTLEKGIAATGRIVFRTHRGTTIPDPSAVSVKIGGAANTITGFGLIAEPSLSADFTFKAAGLRPGRYGVQIQLPETLAGTWSIESAEISDVREAFRCCWAFGVPFDVPVRGTPETVTVVLTDRPAGLSGVVTDRTGRPSPAGVIAIVPADRSAWIPGSSRMPIPVRPGPDGRYAFPALPPGAYLLTALPDVDPDMWKAGIWTDIDTSNAVRVSIASGQQVTLNVAAGGGSIAQAPAGLKTGRAMEEAASGSIVGTVAIVRPQEAVHDVRAFRVWTTAQGERTVGGPSGGYIAQFDGMTGEYRISRLPPGDYIVAAVTLDIRALTGPHSGMIPPRGPLFHPAAMELASAQLVRVEPAAEVRGIDISPLDHPWSTIAGRVVDASGKPSPFPQVDIGLASLPAELRLMLPLQRAPQSATGAFSFRVPPGRYALIARGSGINMAVTASTSRELLGYADVTVSGFDVNDVVVTLEPGATVSGRINFNGANPPPDFTEAVYIRLKPVGGDAVSVQTPTVVTREGVFRIAGVAPGRYWLDAITSQTTWKLDQARVGDRDTRDVPLEIRGRESITDAVITFTDRPSELACAVQDASGAPTSALAIAMVPADPALRRAGSPRLPTPGHPGTDGRFVVTGLPPGDYLIFALTDFDPHAWAAGIWPEFNPASAVRVSIAAGEKRTVAVRISR